MSSSSHLEVKRAIVWDVLILAAGVVGALLIGWLFANAARPSHFYTYGPFYAHGFGAALGLILIASLNMVILRTAIRAGPDGVEIRTRAGRIRRIPWQEIVLLHIWLAPKPFRPRARRIVVAGVDKDGKALIELGSISERIVSMPLDDLHRRLTELWERYR